MWNKNVIYVDYLESYLDILNIKFPKWFRKMSYKILNFWGYVKQEDNCLTLMCVENEKMNKKMIDGVLKKVKAMNTNNIVFAEKLLKNEEFISIFKNNLNILDGRWLFKFLIFSIIQKISFIQNRRTSEYEVTILCNNPTEIIFENIKKLSQNCKVVNVLTVSGYQKFVNIENELYEKYGLLLNISTNLEKVCLFSDIIINIDFDVVNLNQCRFKDKSILIQCTKEKFEKNFKAVITFYRLSFDKSYMSFFNRNKNFEEEILYESLFYYPISLEGMEKFLLRDNVKIRNFEGLHGKINFRELIT